jgi:hypothetical protein
MLVRQISRARCGSAAPLGGGAIEALGVVVAPGGRQRGGVGGGVQIGYLFERVEPLHERQLAVVGEIGACQPPAQHRLEMHAVGLVRWQMVGGENLHLEVRQVR